MTYIDPEIEKNKNTYDSVMKNDKTKKCCGTCAAYKQAHCEYYKKKVNYDEICGLYDSKGNSNYTGYKRTGWW